MNHIMQRRGGIQERYGEDEPSFTTDPITLSCFVKEASILTGKMDFVIFHLVLLPIKILVALLSLGNGNA